MEKFENYASVYKNKIQSFDELLITHESTLFAQNGDYIKVYSIETPNHICFGVTLTVVSVKKAKLLIEFSDADEAWSDENCALFARFISKLSNCELQFDEINAACNSIGKLDEYKLNKNTRLFWDDYHSMLYYEEHITLDMIS